MPTPIFEDNAACIAQVRGWYIKGNKTKYISSKFFYTHELQQSRQIDVKQIRSTDNLADLFTKTLPTSTFEKLVYGIGMRRLCKLQDWYWSFIQGERSIRGRKILNECMCTVFFFLLPDFVPLGFTGKVLMRQFWTYPHHLILKIIVYILLRFLSHWVFPNKLKYKQWKSKGEYCNMCGFPHFLPTCVTFTNLLAHYIMHGQSMHWSKFCRTSGVNRL